MNKLTGTLSAIRESALGVYQMRIRPRLTIRLLLYVALAIALLYACSSFFDWFHNRSYEKREQRREAQRMELEQQASELRESANNAEMRAAELDRENKRLQAEVEAARQEVEAIANQKEKVRIIHAKAKEQLEKELAATTDSVSLRRANCLRRRALGYDCPDE